MTARRRTLARATLLTAPAAAAGAAAQQRRHLRRIADDPEQAVLREPPSGRPLAIRSADGTRLHAELFGPEDGRTIVLAHGWTEALVYWTYVTQELARRGFRVVAFDLRGHGQSEPAAGGDYAIERFGEDLEAVLGAVLEDGQRAIIAGHSLGAMSLVAWAERHDVRARACGAALINTGVGDLIADTLLIPLPAVAKFVNQTIGGARFMGSRARVPKFSTPITHAIIRYVAFGPAATPARIAFYERMLAACSPDARADTGITLSELDLRKAVPQLRLPTLVIAGELDRLTPPPHARRIAEQLPQLHALIVLDATGHMAPLERPQAVTDALAQLAEAAARAAAVAA